jgi:hypothetical protein
MRKKAFTRALVDEFIRSESGLPAQPARVEGKPVRLGQTTPAKPISLEESKALLRTVLKKT